MSERKEKKKKITTLNWGDGRACKNILPQSEKQVNPWHFTA